MTHPRWDDPTLYPRSDGARIRRYRRLQSWYREVQLQAAPGVSQATTSGRLGSLLETEQVVAQPDINFLHPEAARHAKERALEVQEEHGTLEVGRLRHNLLSSMPLCFNLFGALRAEPAFLELLRACFDPDAASVEEVTCEWAPRPEDHLGDRTAFDAFVAYRRADGSRAFIGVETKYTEPFSRSIHGRKGGKQAGEVTPRGERYRDVTDECRWFVRGRDAAEALELPAANQLWRNALLAASLEGAGSFGTGSVIVASTDGDAGAAKALGILGAELEDPERVRRVSLESIVSAAEDIDGLGGWARRFRHRYLDVDAPDTRPHHRDADGPRLGSLLTAPGP